MEGFTNTSGGGVVTLALLGQPVSMPEPPVVVGVDPGDVCCCDEPAEGTFDLFVPQAASAPMSMSTASMSQHRRRKISRKGISSLFLLISSHSAQLAQ